MVQFDRAAFGAVSRLFFELRRRLLLLPSNVLYDDWTATLLTDASMAGTAWEVLCAFYLALADSATQRIDFSGRINFFIVIRDELRMHFVLCSREWLLMCRDVSL